jgi:hypothetical protein
MFCNFRLLLFLCVSYLLSRQSPLNHVFLLLVKKRFSVFHFDVEEV